MSDENKWPSLHYSMLDRCVNDRSMSTGLYSLSSKIVQSNTNITWIGYISHCWRT